MNKFSPLFSFIFLSLGALVISFFLEYNLGLEACALCKMQRLPYFFIFVISLFYLLANLAYLKNSKPIIKSTLATPLIYLRGIQILFFVGFCLAFFQILVQIGLLSDFCAVPEITSIEQFERLLEKKNGCSSLIKILGIPVSGWNLIFSVICLVTAEIFIKKLIKEN